MTMTAFAPISIKNQEVKKTRPHLSVLKDMLYFVQKNYAKEIALADIAKSGNVSKNTCLAIFKKYLKDTPANYLIGYRLKTAMKLLKEPKM